MKASLTVRELVLFGVLGGATFAAKLALSPLPNIEPVSLFLLLFTVVFGWKALFPLYVYVALEFLLWPSGLWNLNYLYVWLFLVLAARGLRGMRQPLGWAVLSGGFGLLFGLLSAPVYCLVGGPAYAAAWWLSGIPFDLLHCAGNFFLALTLFRPLRALLESLTRRLL